MQIQVDSLKYAKLLVKNGIPQNQAEGLVESISTMEIRNIYDKNEINNMLTEAVKNVIEEQRREFDKRMELAERQVEREIAESRSRHRWLIGTIVTVGVAIIGYLSAFMHQISNQL